MRIEFLLEAPMMISQLNESIGNVGEKAIKKALPRTKVKYYTSENGDKSVMVDDGQSYTYTSGDSSVKMNQSEWRSFESALIESGYKQETNKKNLYRWLPFLRSVLKWVSVLAVSGIVIAALIITTSSVIPTATLPLMMRQLGGGKIMDFVMGKFRSDVENGAFVLKQEIDV